MFEKLLNVFFYLPDNTIIQIEAWIESQRINKLIAASTQQNKAEFLTEIARIISLR